MNAFCSVWRRTLNVVVMTVSHLEISSALFLQFTDSKEPLEADEWLRTIERKFSALRVHPNDCFNFATYQLEGEAGVWWEGFLNLQAQGHVVTWEEFVAAFRASYIPKPIMDLKRRQFLDLTLGHMDIESYGREFTRLACNAPNDL